MKIRLLEVGFNNLTGFVGTIEFENGVSVGDITQRQADAIACAMRAETVEDEPIGGAVSPASKDVEADIIVPMDRNDKKVEASVEVEVEVEDEGVEIEASVEDKGVDIEAPVEVEEVTVVHTFESLGEIADAEGIAGVRKVAEEYGIKGRSVKDLIDGILKAGEKPKKKG